MQNFRNKLIAGGAVLVLAAIGTVLNRQAVQAAGGPSVTIESPIPLPVTGTVAATQSGTWNVGIIGIPGVNINNSPTVGLASGTTALTRNLEDPGRIPYQSTVDMSGKCSGNNCTFSFAAVPSGHRLVVTHIGGALDFNTPSQMSFLVVRAPNVFLSSFLAQGATQIPIGGIDQPLLFYLDQFQSVFIVVELVSNGATFSGGTTAQILTLAGYMLDCTVATCAAIAN